MGNPVELPTQLEQSISSCLRRTADEGWVEEKLPQHFRTLSAREAFKNVFELVGGVPRFAYWADANYDRFIQLFGRMIQAQQPGATADEPLHIELSWGNGQRFNRPERTVTNEQPTVLPGQLPLFNDLPAPVPSAPANSPESIREGPA